MENRNPKTLKRPITYKLRGTSITLSVDEFVRNQLDKSSQENQRNSNALKSSHVRMKALKLNAPN